MEEKEKRRTVEIIEESGFLLDENWVRCAVVKKEGNKYHVESFNGRGSFTVMKYKGNYVIENEKGERRETVIK